MLSRTANHTHGDHPAVQLLSLSFILFLFVSACMSNDAVSTLPSTQTPANTTPPQTPTKVLPPTPSAAPVQADVVLTEAQHQQTTSVQVGQVVNIQNFPEFEWAVSYNPDILLALTPSEMMKAPGESGWLFRVVAPGNTEIMLESLPPPCPGTTPCPPNIIRLVFPIQAVR